MSFQGGGDQQRMLRSDSKGSNKHTLCGCFFCTGDRQNNRSREKNLFTREVEEDMREDLK